MEILAFVIGVLVIVVGLAVSIALHEIGHLLPAKRFGLRVGQYMVGFGPTLWSRRIGETEYGVKALPIGGYISMAGMYPPSPELRAEQGAAPGAADAGEGHAPAPGAAPAGETAHAASAPREGDAHAPSRGDAGTGEHEAPRRRDRLFATLVQDARAANDETLEGTEQGRAFYQLSTIKRVIIMLGGPVMNLLLAVVIFTVLFSGIGTQQATTTISSLSECVPSSAQAECTANDPPAPAAASGLEPGDVMREIDGQPVSTFDEAARVIEQHPGETISIVVERGGSEQTVQLTPAATEREVAGPGGEVTTQQVGFAGVSPTVEYVREPIWTGAQTAVENVGIVAGVMVELPVRVYDTAVSLFTGTERDPDGPLSVVGVGRLAGEVAQADAPVLNRLSVMIGLLGSVNVALFVFNLIPLLPLDGGHVLIALWDGLRRAWAKLFNRPPPRATDATRLMPVTLVVVALLIAVGSILILADLFNPIDILGGG